MVRNAPVLTAEDIPPTPRARGAGPGREPAAAGEAVAGTE